MASLIEAYADRPKPDSVAVVGNQPLELDHRRAKTIDSGDLVFRVNGFVCDEPGQAPTVGSKTHVQDPCRRIQSGVYLEPERYACSGLVTAPASDDVRVTLDTEQDWSLLEALVAELGDRTPGGGREIVYMLRARPDLVVLNAQVEQRSAE